MRTPTIRALVRRRTLLAFLSRSARRREMFLAIALGVLLLGAPTGASAVELVERQERGVPVELVVYPSPGLSAPSIFGVP
jgi:hypothetical protein